MVQKYSAFQKTVMEELENAEDLEMNERRNYRMNRKSNYRGRFDY